MSVVDPSTEAEPRSRLLEGLAMALRTQEFADVTIADIVQHARTSRRTFYECFDSKQECFVALVQQVNEQRRAAIVAAIDLDASIEEQILQAVRAMLSVESLEPTTFARAMRAVHSLGGRGRELIRGDVENFIALLDALSSRPELRSLGVEPPSRESAVVLIGGIRELIITALEDGQDVQTLAEPVAEIIQRILVPPKRQV